MDPDELLSMGFTVQQIQQAYEIAPDRVLDYLLREIQEVAHLNALHPTPVNELHTQGSFSSSGSYTVATISQFSFPNGRSACTCIALQALSTLLPLVATSVDPNPLSSINVDTLSDIIIKGIELYGTIESRYSEHTSVEEVYNACALDSIIPIDNTIQSPLSQEVFQTLINYAITARNKIGVKCVGVVITKPPESICMFLSIKDDGSTEYMILDSHHRPQLGIEGGYFYVTTDAKDVIEKLRSLFPPLELDAGASVFEQMYNMLEYSLFTVSGGRVDYI